MNTREEIIKKLKELKPELYSQYSVIRIGLFGSFSDLTHSGSSDIDILVELEHPIGWRFFSLELYLQDVFKRKIDLVTKNALKSQMKDSILQQVIYA